MPETGGRYNLAPLEGLELLGRSLYQNAPFEYREEDCVLGFRVLGFRGFGVLGFLGLWRFGALGCWGFGVLGINGCVAYYSCSYSSD